MSFASNDFFLILIGTLAFTLEGHGRESQVISDFSSVSEVDITRTVGWFTSVFPAAVSVTDTTAVVETLKEVKEQLRAIPNKGVGFGVSKYLAKSELSSSVTFDVNCAAYFDVGA